jgi:hypothetical protein
VTKLTDLNETILVLRLHIRIGLQHSVHIRNHSDTILILIKNGQLFVELLWSVLMDTISLKKSEKGVKSNPFLFGPFKATREHFTLVLFIDEVHTNRVEINLELVIGESVLVVLIKLLEDGLELSLQVLVNETFFEFH